MVERYNQEFAGKRLPNGQTAPPLTLPADYSFNDNFFTQDLRLSRTFPLGGERVRLILFGEVFNLLNTANLVGYGGNLANPASSASPARASHRSSAPAARVLFSSGRGSVFERRFANRLWL